MPEYRIPSGYTSYHDYEHSFLANVVQTSGTALTGRQQGKRGRRPGKPFAGINGQPLRDQALNNMQRIALKVVIAVEEGWELEKVVDTITRDIHWGLPNGKKRLSRLRTHETATPYGCPAAEVEERFAAFRAELARRLNDPSTDPVLLAAWVDYKLRYEIHPLADGSGRLATALAAYVCVRAGLVLPQYRIRSELHAALREGFDSFACYYRENFFRREDWEGRANAAPFDQKQTTAYRSPRARLRAASG